MKYKIVDKKAPRFRKTEFETRLVVKDLHKEFVEKTGIQISLEEFKALYEENMEVIKHFIETERNGVLLPEQMGNMILSFFKMKRPAYNYIEGMATGNGPQDHLFHSYELQGKIVWSYRDLKYKPREFHYYGFVGCRDLKQRASKAFINTPELFRKYVYTKIENAKKRLINRYECYYQGGYQSTEGVEQSSQLGQPADQQVPIFTDKQTPGLPNQTTPD